MTTNTITRVVLVLSLSSIGAGRAEAQSVVGAWTRISLKDSAGKAIQPPEPPAFVIFSANGLFSQSAIPAGRPKVAKALADMTKSELLARFDHAEAWRGSYTVAGTKLKRKTIADIDPTGEGNELIQIMRFAGDTLILTRVNAAVNKSEARFVRVR
jgi:hypothetical protein